VERLLKLHSDVTDAPLSPSTDHLIRGVLAAAKGDTASGIEEIRLAQDLDPKDEEAIFQLGAAYLHAGDYESALNTFQRLIDLTGSVLLEKPPLLVPLSIYRIALCYEHLGNSASAKFYRTELAAIWSGADENLRRRYLDGVLDRK
jgi:tetratricopeptide (TPR) repeat protein